MNAGKHDIDSGIAMPPRGIIKSIEIIARKAKTVASNPMFFSNWFFLVVNPIIINDNVKSTKKEVDVKKCKKNVVSGISPIPMSANELAHNM